jgi:hypothetical protein
MRYFDRVYEYVREPQGDARAEDGTQQVFMAGRLPCQAAAPLRNDPDQCDETPITVRYTVVDGLVVPVG